MVNSKKITTLVFSLLAGIFVSQSALAASSIYYSSKAYGVSYGQDSVSKAKAIAKKSCEKESSKKEAIVCRELGSTDLTGYGAVAVGYNKNDEIFIGAALGAESKKDATRRALESCKKSGATEDIEIKETFLDE